MTARLPAGTAARLAAGGAGAPLLLLVFWSIPVVGLVAGGSYAALIFGLAGVRLLWLAAVDRSRLLLDLPPLLLAAAFALLCWASWSWSFAPARTATAALQVSAILVGAVATLAACRVPAEAVAPLMRGMQTALLVGAAIVLADRLAGFALQGLLTSGALNAPTKYNRGIDYLMVLVWPLLGYAAVRREWRRVAAGAAAVAVIVVAGQSSTSVAAGALALATLGASFVAARAVGLALRLAVALLGFCLPFLLHLLTGERTRLAAAAKRSFVHRLEIWDYMTSRALERPLAGWGFGTAKAVPIRPDELAAYRYVSPGGEYPHNQWLEAWVGLGALGAVLLALFCLLVLRRIGRLEPAIRPFAYAAFAAGLATSLADFELITDSWWAALAAGAVLCGAAARGEAERRAAAAA